jgi:hypothetical protein
MTYVNPDAEEAPEKTTLTLFAELGWQAYHKVYGDGPQESAGLYLVAELLELVGLPALRMTEGDVGMSLPEQIEDAMRNAIQDLTVVLEWEVLDAPTHRTVIVIGWNRDDSTRQAIAHYLVGLRACAIDAALNIRAELEDSEEDRIEVLGNVIAIVGEDNAEDTEEQKRRKIYERNPWIAEGIWHLCMIIAAKQRREIHLPGAIIALNYAHPIAKDHGLDVAAIYEIGDKDLFGLSFIESKAYKDNIDGAISKAVGFFREINEGKKHALRIRQTVQIMRSSLPGDKQAQIPNSFWKRTRAYLPNPHYDASCRVDWTNSRPSFDTLRLDGVNTDIIVMPHIINEFANFFDEIADEMRAFARSL